MKHASFVPGSKIDFERVSVVPVIFLVVERAPVFVWPIKTRGEYRFS